MAKVKICGICSAEDIDAINKALPDYIGFVFAPGKRQINPDTAAKLMEKLNPHIETVGIFKNENIETVATLYQNRIIDLAQLEGDEDDNYLFRLKDSYGCRIIKAASLDRPLPAFEEMPDYLIVDISGSGMGDGSRGEPGSSVGSNGTSSSGGFDWQAFSKTVGLPFFVTGDITADNVADIVRAANPYCVNVNLPFGDDGKVDIEGMREFIKIVRAGA